MLEPAKKLPLTSSPTVGASTRPSPAAKKRPKVKAAQRPSKQSRVIAMLQSPTGATIAAMMKATGWQQHSVRGFLAGVVSKRLKLKLQSEKIDGNRIYRIAETNDKLATRPSKRR